MKKITTIFIAIAVSSSAFCLQFGNGNDVYSTVFIQTVDGVKDFCVSDLFETYIIKQDDSLWSTGAYFYETFYDKKDLINTFEKIDDDVRHFDGRYLVKNDGTSWEVFREFKKS